MEVEETPKIKEEIKLSEFFGNSTYKVSFLKLKFHFSRINFNKDRHVHLHMLNHCLMPQS